MRKLAVILAVVLVLGVCAQSALAVAVPAGDKLAKIRDFSNLYRPPTVNDPPGWVAQPLSGLPPDLGDENRSIFTVTQILPDGGFIPDWNTSAAEELTGLFYELELVAITPGAAGNLILDFAPLGAVVNAGPRNPLPAPGAPAGSGGVVEIYADTSPDFNPDPGGLGFLESILPTLAPVDHAARGPHAWLDGAGVEVAGRDMYPTVSDGSLWLSGVFVPFSVLGIPGHHPATVFSETFNLGDGSGTGQGQFVPVGGAYAGLIPGLVEISANLHFPSVTFPAGGGIMLNDVQDYDGLGWWQVDSDDPVHFTVIPEPGTMCLLGVGLLGLVIRRKK